MSDYTYHDPELPAGFQEADILQAQYEAEGRELAARHARGECTHGARLARRVPEFYNAEDVAVMVRTGMFKNREGWSGGQAQIPEGKDLCTECGALVDAWDEAF